jgi:hypothetical protein
LQKIVEGLKNYQLLMKLAVSLVQGISWVVNSNFRRLLWSRCTWSTYPIALTKAGVSVEAVKMITGQKSRITKVSFSYYDINKSSG